MTYTNIEHLERRITKLEGAKDAYEQAKDQYDSDGQAVPCKACAEKDEEAAALRIRCENQLNTIANQSAEIAALKAREKYSEGAK